MSSAIPVLVAGGLACAVHPGRALAQCEPQETAKLAASDGEQNEDFGWSVSISADAAIVGARLEDTLGEAAGAAYVFERVGDEWTQTAKLTASNGAMDDQFGIDVSIDGDTALVGASFHDGIEFNTGSAYVFERMDGVWTETDELTASDAAFNTSFGSRVLVAGDTAFIRGADASENTSAVYVFERVGDSWMEADKLEASDAQPFGAFGNSMSMSGDALLVGAFTNNDLGTSSGSVYVFEKIGTDWVEVDKLHASDGAELDHFGVSVSVSGDTAIVGARWDDDDGDKSGSAYVFERIDGVWTEVAKLTASDASPGDSFGGSVALMGDTAVVGAGGANAGAGAAYVFQGNDGAWTEVASLTASNGAEGDGFGWSASMDGDTALLGAQNGNGLVPDSGSAYVFELNCACPADVNGDGELNVLDFVAFQLLWQDGDPTADCDANAEFNVLDFVCFQQRFVEGCE